MDKSQKPADGIAEGYQRAGENFLAYRLELVFKILKTPEDVALHNDVVKEIFFMTNSNFGKQTATSLVKIKFKNTKDFLCEVGRIILSNLRRR